MIATIEGLVADKPGDNAIIELGGIGYEVVLSAADWGSTPTGQIAKFYIYEHIREDSHQLFGFKEPRAKQLFIKLLGVSGVGPKVAMQVMSAASIDSLLQSIGAGDVDLFKGVSGVGKKTAERIMVELRGKVDVAMPGAVASTGDAAYQALVGLGYSQTQAAEALASVPSDITDEQERVKMALKGVSK